MDFLFLALYAALFTVALVRSRSTAWVVITLAAASALAGTALMFLRDRGVNLDRLGLQVLLAVVLVLVAVLAWVPALGFSARAPGTRVGAARGSGWRRQALTLWVPAGLIVLAVVVVTALWAEGPAFLKPVSYLMGNAEAEDNATWLEFTAQFASGGQIDQAVPMGGPLQLLMTAVATLMGVVSRIALGGYNEVAVAANTVVFAQLLMPAVVLFALAPLVETRIRRARIPVPIVWVAGLFLASVAFVLVRYGHLTLQYVILIVGLWSAVYLARLRMRRAALLSSVAVAGAMTVWLPLNALALVLLIGWLAVLVWRATRVVDRTVDVVGIVLVGLLLVGLGQPILSSITYSLAIDAGAPAGGAVRGVTAFVQAGLDESPLFTALGGTEQVGPILAILAAASVLSAGLVLQGGRSSGRFLVRFVPLGLLAGNALAIYVLDFWSTGSGPHYGSLKFTFLLAVIAVGTALPVGLLLLDPAAGSRMTGMRWMAVAGVVVLLMIDSILPRAVASLRPQQWSPPIPFDNTSGSYWHPAEVNGTGDQPISSVPVACIYLPEGSPYPTAIVPSGLSDAQRVYGCTRLLIGLSGEGVDAQYLIDWVRREWTTNTPAWTDVYDGLALVPAPVRARPIILLDDGSNVIGLESLDSLLQRFPKPESQG